MSTTTTIPPRVEQSEVDHALRLDGEQSSVYLRLREQRGVGRSPGREQTGGGDSRRGVDPCRRPRRRTCCGDGCLEGAAAVSLRAHVARDAEVEGLRRSGNYRL
jgi:hypothetical protein